MMQFNDIPPFKIGCASIGKIMTEPRQKTRKGELSETAKSYCENWLKSHLYGKKKLFTSKYSDKGNIVEDDSIAYIEIALKWDDEFVIKNEVKKEDEYIKGICDVNLRRKIIDTKNSYDCFTFPLFDEEIPDSDYDWQGQGYMELYGKSECEIIYVLMGNNTRKNSLLILQNRINTHICPTN